VVCTGKYLDYYWDRRQNIYVSPSIEDAMQNSAYVNYNGRTRLKINGYSKPALIAELTAAYYGLIEEGACALSYDEEG